MPWIVLIIIAVITLYRCHAEDKADSQTSPPTGERAACVLSKLTTYCERDLNADTPVKLETCIATVTGQRHQMIEHSCRFQLP
jgi:hypothetical protein